MSTINNFLTTSFFFLRGEIHNGHSPDTRSSLMRNNTYQVSSVRLLLTKTTSVWVWLRRASIPSSNAARPHRGCSRVRRMVFWVCVGKGKGRGEGKNIHTFRFWRTVSEDVLRTSKWKNDRIGSNYCQSGSVTVVRGRRTLSRGSLT